MKRIVFTATALALCSGSTFAADLPSRKAPPVYLPPPPVMTWQGFYAGLNAGGTFGGDSTTHVLLPAQPGFDPGAIALGATTQNNSPSGFIGGGQIGYNWQFNSSFVLGLEADIQGIAGTSNNGGTGAASGPSVLHPANTLAGFGSTSQSLDYLGTVRGRVGFLFTPTLLVYGTGGLAYGQTNLSHGSFGTETTPAGAVVGFSSSSGTYSDTREGWTAGGGVEWMFHPNWSAKVEYLYYDLGTVYVNEPTIAVALPSGATASPTTGQSTVHFNGHVVRAGLNYHFNWGAPVPVVAKY